MPRRAILVAGLVACAADPVAAPAPVPPPSPAPADTCGALCARTATCKGEMLAELPDDPERAPKSAEARMLLALVPPADVCAERLCAPGAFAEGIAAAEPCLRVPCMEFFGCLFGPPSECRG
jgi:hypothetical protein